MAQETTAVRLYGANDLRIERFALPPTGERQVLMRVVTDSLCASTYKAVLQGTAHKRVPPDVAEHPVIIGHELCGELVEVGAALRDRWHVGDRVVIQPALKLESGYDPGYSYPTVGGNTVYALVPEIVMERDCLIAFPGDSYFAGSLVESLGCCLRGLKGLYHTDYQTYIRTDGPKEGGKMAILGGAGPMGIGLCELALAYGRTRQLVVTDLSPLRLDFAREQCPPHRAAELGTDLRWESTAGLSPEETVEKLLALSEGGFDDVFVMVPSPALFSMAEKIAREDGCINFFAGPPVHELPGSVNLYRIHYDGIHIVGTAGSIPEDTRDTIGLITQGKLQPGALVSHIMGLRAVPEAIFAMAHPDGAKKVCYNALDLPVIAVRDFEKLGKENPLFAVLAEITGAHGGLWCKEAEDYLLAHAPRLEDF